MIAIELYYSLLLIKNKIIKKALEVSRWFCNSLLLNSNKNQI